MTKRDTEAKAPEIRGAKGAAQAAIGKLIGDDAEVRKGHDEEAAADRAAAARDQSTIKEK